MNEKRRGFTLIELLVVVLIIGILAGVALPQYNKAVDKARVATMLPLMRRWVDALALYKLENGSYANADENRPTADELGVSWPSDWTVGVNGNEGQNNLWYCFANEEVTGYVYCQANWKDPIPMIIIYQPDDPDFPDGKRYCSDNESFCKSLGGKPIEGHDGYYEF